MTKVVNKGELRKEKGGIFLSLLAFAHEDKRHLGKSKIYDFVYKQSLIH